MLRNALMASALLFSGSAFAQSEETCTPCGTEPRYAGVYDVATGVFHPMDVPPEFNEQVIYNNTCPTSFFTSMVNGSVLIDDGRIPTVNTPSPNKGTRSTYRVTKFDFAYCTRELDISGGGPGATARVLFWNDYDDCATFAAAGVPAGDFTLTGLPGSSAQGTLACWIVTINLVGGFEFCLSGEANSTFDNSDLLDGFGYGLQLTGQLGTTTSTSGGWFLAGSTAPIGGCAFGAGTYYNTPSAAGNGLGNNNLFRRDGAGGQTSGCLAFSGTGTPYAAFYMKIFADLDDCLSCSPSDFDADGTDDCNDGCPGDPLKTAPGQCGCGVAETGDTDGDGVFDCVDGCPDDPNKSAPGQCGCGVADTDSDGDGSADCVDGCPNDPLKTAPGLCGCGVADDDSDFDGVEDCNDGCPNDFNKTDPGQCGCGVADTDTDGDGTADCIDGCPDDPNKTSAGQCGCGAPDTDTDGDGTADCNDGCPDDPNKISGGQCGCGVADTDTDGDGTADCNDGCPDDPNKTSGGVCGCGVADTDTDGDGVADCNDNCVSISNPGQEDCNGNGAGDPCDIAGGSSLDVNGNGQPDECEQGAGIPFCFGDGSNGNCPCGNNDGTGHGCANSTGVGALLYNLGSASINAADTDLYTTLMPTNKTGLFYMGSLSSAPRPLGAGLRCPKGFTHRFAVLNSGLGGSFAMLDTAAQEPSLIVPGTTWYFQTWYRDPSGPCGATTNLSNALQIDFLP